MPWPHAKPWSKADVSRCCDLRKGGASLDQVAQAMGRSKNAVKRVLFENKVVVYVTKSNVLDHYGDTPPIDQPAAVKCLCCQKQFASENRKTNRICGPCKGMDIFRGVA